MGQALLPSLRRPAQFQAVMKHKPCARTAHFAAHALTLQEPSDLFVRQSQLGLVIPKRHARRAVTRNLIKRQIRALWAQPCVNSNSKVQAVPEATVWVVRLTQAFDTTVFVSASSDQLKAAVRAELIDLHQRACHQMTAHAEAKSQIKPNASELPHSLSRS